MWYTSVRQTDAVLNCELWPMCGEQNLFSMRVIFRHEVCCTNFVYLATSPLLYGQYYYLK